MMIAVRHRRKEAAPPCEGGGGDGATAEATSNDLFVTCCVWSVP